MSTQSRHLAGLREGFGPNEWLIEEMYEQYLSDPSSVDVSWHEFFSDYKPDFDEAISQESAPTQTAAHPNGVRTDARTQDRPAEQAAPPYAKDQPEVVTATTPMNHDQVRRAAPSQAVEKQAPTIQADTHVKPLRGAAARVVSNMETSLSVPTATSVRATPAKLVADNRTVINNHLRRARGGKVSFTHLIGYAMVRALQDLPEINNSYAERDGKPTVVVPDHINVGLAIDLKKDDGGRSLVVASIKACETMDFSQFWLAYEETIRKARTGTLTPEDFSGTTITLTNPGTIGTVHSVPRLMTGQGCILGVGAMEYPAEFQGRSEEALAAAGISKTLTLTSTYDHRIIQGAQSGEFLRRIHELLLGGDNFYDDVFTALRVPYEPVRWVQDKQISHEGQIDKPTRVIELINAYRTSGHLMADTNPLEFALRSHPDLDIIKHGLTLWDLDREFPVGGFAGERLMKLREVLGVLRDAYCRRVGVEYMYITNPEERRWLQERIEVKNDEIDHTEQKHILGRLNAAEAFETFLQTKYVGQKRFSLEGAESVIPLLDAILRMAADQQLDEVCIGMPHRGRLNVLANIIGKSYAKIFREFSGNVDPASVQGSGDVKYHLGSTGTFTSLDNRTVTVTLTANPSHLEAVDPVLEGIVRAKQDLLDKGEEGFTVLPVLLHGDAAFAGQGVVAETLNLSQLRGYRTGGTVHVVVNNQVGFTTSPKAARSSLYCTDVARMIQAPIFHVNSDDPEACVRVAKLAVEYRRKFKKDVVIDLVCYRRRGHNEADNPSFTQPQMYDVIDAKRSVRKLYTEALVGRGDITMEEAEDALRDYQEQLERVFLETREATGRPRPEPVMHESMEEDVRTAISSEALKRIGNSYVSLPTGFSVHPRLKPQLERRAVMATDGGIDWGFAELCAFGSLLLQGRPVRLSGQDSRRGTFVQRHATLIDRQTGEEYTPLKYLEPGQAPFWVYDSLLSEFAAMGFEYGYSVTNSDALVLWEAQFGDFANGAQSIIDEFVSSGEAKWRQRSGVVLLLPHGYEGQGPDHSSARIERYLQVCAEDNMTVSMPSTPASYFHLLRRQALGTVHRPLVIFTPKSLLRLKAATSSPEDLTEGSFRPVLPDGGDGSPTIEPGQVSRVLLCSGKIFYDLNAYRVEHNITNTAIVRLEQFYPLPGKQVSDVLDTYPNAREFVWTQEEPENMGAWTFIALHLPQHLQGRQLHVLARPESASPAAGSSAVHQAEQARIVESAFA